MAIFIIIVISLLGASLMSLQRNAAESTSYEVYAARAYLAAYSASEIALMKLFPLGSSAAVETSCSETAEAVTLPGDDETAEAVTLPGDDETAGFHGCSALYSCSVISAATVTRYQITSTASCKSNEIITRRQIMVEATNVE
ncbi:hypothetical protein ACR30L_14395 [Psychromonas sp. PT13]|uniref:hypothetical protein n=1 Tax=Psychromonas sp. PT13 TaxID=3439547 RepID=UPI003EBD52EC